MLVCLKLFFLDTCCPACTYLLPCMHILVALHAHTCCPAFAMRAYTQVALSAYPDVFVSHVRRLIES
jgi:hypothetical protein